MKKFFLIIATIIGLNLLIPIKPSQSFVPRIYEPNTKKLRKTGLEIGFTAAHLIKIGQFKEATGLAKVALSLNPEEIDLWMILAEGQIRSKKIDEAMDSINKAKSINSNVAEIWFIEGSLALNQNKPKLAISSLSSGLKIDDSNSRAYFQLGNARIMENQYQSALKDFKKSFSLNKKFWQALNNEGLVLYELNKESKAIKSWEKVLLINQDAEPKLALAAALNKINPKNQKSITLTKEALNQSPNYIYKEYRKEQLWGKSLQAATAKLLSRTELSEEIEKALINGDFKNEF